VYYRRAALYCAFLWSKGLNTKDISKEMFPVYGGKYQERSKVADDETEVRKWLRQQPKYFYAAGFDALVKRWDKFYNFGGECVEK
jgi:hypothetical protein